MGVFTISHWVATSPEEVWKAYTTPELFHQFFSPDGLHIPIESVVLELEVGGRCEFNMVFDEAGDVNENKGVIVELQPPHTLVFSEPEFMDGKFLSTQTFTAEENGTVITVTQEGLPDELVGNPEVIEAFRSTFRKMGRLLGIATENR